VGVEIYWRRKNETHDIMRRVYTAASIFKPAGEISQKNNFAEVETGCVW